MENKTNEKKGNKTLGFVLIFGIVVGIVYYGYNKYIAKEKESTIVTDTTTANQIKPVDSTIVFTDTTKLDSVK